MWLNVKVETAWNNLFKGEKLPRIVILNPGIKKKYVLHEGIYDDDSMS